MEQSDSGKCHYHIVLIAAFNYCIISHGTAGLSNIFYAALVCALNIVREGEERIGAKGYILHLVKPCSLFFSGKYGRLNLKDTFPYAISQNIHVFVTHIYVDGIIPVCSAEAIYKLQKAGIVQGSEGKFNPLGNASRGELCKMLSGLVVSD